MTLDQGSESFEVSDREFRFMFAKFGWTQLIASALVLTVATSSLADDVLVKEGVVVKPLSKRKQRKLEKKLLKRPGNKVVIEGTPTASPAPEVFAGAKARRALRPLFPDRFGRRNDVVVGSPIITSPGFVVSTPRTVIAPGDPLVMPGSVEVDPSARGVRPPVVSTPRGQSRPIDPTDEPDLEMERPGSARILPPPADEIPPPVVSIPRKPATSPTPMPSPIPSTSPAPASPARGSTVPSVDPGPSSSTPPPAPEPEPVVEPPLELPQAPKPA